MKSMKTAEIAALGLVALLSAGCEASRDSKVTREDRLLTKPQGCERVLDIRYEYGRGNARGYQVLCEDISGNKVLYDRPLERDYWVKIEVR